jgi:HEAT repeat protein
MSLRREVRELLRQGREDAVSALATAEPKALPPLMGRLWDPDAQIRKRAARAVGRTVAARPELGTEIIRRLMWALNDESATHGVYGIPALGEIGRRAPAVLAPFVPSLVTLAADPGLRLELLAALQATAEAAPGLVAGQLDRLAAWIDDSRPEQRQAFHRLEVAASAETPNGD